MRRLLVLALLGLVAGRADAQLLKITNGDYPKKRHKSGNEPPPLGPVQLLAAGGRTSWCRRCPSIPTGASLADDAGRPARRRTGARPAIGGPAANGPGNGFGAYPGFAPANNAAPPGSSNQPPAQMQPAGSARSPYQANPYPALSGYPGYGYPGYGYGNNPQWQARPQAAPNQANPPRP
ncbi:MAG: hypothetical protein U0797_14175 [Gemmataceae bacterium]